MLVIIADHVDARALAVAATLVKRLDLTGGGLDIIGLGRNQDDNKGLLALARSGTVRMFSRSQGSRRGRREESNSLP
jgi:hypothetical protein